VVYLEGSPELIKQRLAQRRGHFMPPALLDSQFAVLEEPTADEKAIVANIAGTPEVIVSEIVAQLRARAT
jgi:gluconokinase